MANRYTLHITHMGAFKQWLAENNYAFRDGKGDFQVLQVMTNSDGWQSIYSRLDMPEHYTVQDKLMYLVKRFLADKKDSADEITRLRQQVSTLTEQLEAAQALLAHRTILGGLPPPDLEAIGQSPRQHCDIQTVEQLTDYAMCLELKIARMVGIQKERLSVATEALNKLARLGNGDRYGNSTGNVIAQQALAALQSSEVPK